jgi:hypothetical protein
MDDQRVAISPIYAAPELFINVDGGGGGQYAKDVACTFDCFSAGMLFCQLLFQYLDEVTDTGFRQQLEFGAKWNLNTWLQAELASKFRPGRNSLQNALQVLAERPGLWTLLQDLLQPDPRDRCSAQRALERWKEIKQQSAQTARTSTTTIDEDENKYVDGAYLQEVLQSMDICIIPDDEITVIPDISTVSTVAASTPTKSTSTITSRRDTELVLNSRPLQYVATFRRKQSLGLLLAEAYDKENQPDILKAMTNESHRAYWQHVIVPQARPGEVYIYGIVPLGQADEMEIFEVGVRFSSRHRPSCICGLHLCGERTNTLLFCLVCAISSVIFSSFRIDCKVLVNCHWVMGDLKRSSTSCRINPQAPRTSLSILIAKQQPSLQLPLLLLQPLLVL